MYILPPFRLPVLNPDHQCDCYAYLICRVALILVICIGILGPAFCGVIGIGKVCHTRIIDYIESI